MENLDFEVSDPADPNKVADANIFHFHIKFPTFGSNFYYWVKALKAFLREKSGGIITIKNTRVQVLRNKKKAGKIK